MDELEYIEKCKAIIKYANTIFPDISKGKGGFEEVKIITSEAVIDLQVDYQKEFYLYNFHIRAFYNGRKGGAIQQTYMYSDRILDLNRYDDYEIFQSVFDYANSMNIAEEIFEF